MWWFKIPVANLRGGLWCPVQIPDSQNDLMGLDIRECKLIRKGDHWSVHITVQKEIPDAQTLIPRCNTILGVDLGEVRPATAVLLKGNEPVKQIMASRKVREVRMHYNWLRQKLGRKKSLRTIRKIGRTERRIVDAHLHKLSKDIVQMAMENNATIVLGDLQGVRERAQTRGKKFRAKIARMPSYRLSNFIEYKALWKDVLVVYINEAYTSKTCHVCGEFGTRPTQGQFLCSNCGSPYNADLNGAINIGLRFMDYMSMNSGSFDNPLNSGDVRQC
jgi:IS605 OrfB family transposase